MKPSVTFSVLMCCIQIKYAAHNNIGGKTTASGEPSFGTLGNEF